MGRVYRIDSSTGEIDIFDESDFGLFIGSVYLADIGNDGIVWMASDYGVFSYDGKEWNRSKNPAGIYLSTREFAHDRLGALAVDANNNVYLTVNGTANYSESYHGPNIRVDNGILRFDTQSWSFIAGRHYVLADAKEIKYQCLAFDRNNDLWYMKGRSLISFINNEEVESSVFPEGVPYPEFTEAGYDDNGVLWLASHRYPWSFDGESWREHEIKEAFSATQMTIEPGGRVWFGGKNGLTSYSDGIWYAYSTAEGLPENTSIQDIKTDPEGNLWALSDRMVFRYNGVSFETFALSGIPSDNVFSVSASGGKVWFATDFGVGGFDGAEWVYFDYDNGLPWDVTGAAAVDSQGKIWITTERGLAGFDGTGFDVYNSGYSEQNFKKMWIDENDLIWLFYQDNISRILVTVDRNGNWKERYRWYSKTTSDFAFDESGTPWISDNGDLLYYDGRRFIQDTAAPTPIARMSGKNGFLYCVSQEGELFRLQDSDWDKVSNIPTVYADIAIDGIAVDKNGNPTLVSTGTALLHFNAESSTWSIGNSPALLSGWSELKGIFYDDTGKLWFHTENGVFFLESQFITETNVQTSVFPSESIVMTAAPNPFNAYTTLSFSLPFETAASLTVYDITGRKVRELFSGNLSAGRHTIVWNGLDENGLTVSSGVYLACLHAEDSTVMRSMTLLK